MIRIVKFQFIYIIKMFVAMILSFSTVYAFIYLISDNNMLSGIKSGLAIGFFITPIVTMQSLNGVYLKIALSFGATRTSFNNILQFSKIFIALIQTILTFIIIEFLPGYEDFGITAFCMIFLTVFLCITIGEFLGISMLKFSKFVVTIINVGLIISIFLMGLISGIVTSLNSDVMYEFIDVLINAFMGISFPQFLIWVYAIMLAVIVVASFINRKLANTVCITN